MRTVTIFGSSLPRPESRAYAEAQELGKLLAQAGYPSGFDAGEFVPYPPYNSMGEAIAGWLQAVGIRMRLRAMERGAFMTAWREKKLHGVVLTISGVSGNAATRLESFVTKNGAFAFGALPPMRRWCATSIPTLSRFSPPIAPRR